MFNKILTAIFGSANERYLKRLRPRIEQINALEPEVKKLTDQQLRDKTAEFRQRLDRMLESVPEEHMKVRLQEALDELLPEAFAVVREASVRTTGMRHFDVQLIGGIVLHEGKIAEMKTGEGKTLVATLPAYLNALAGRGVHIVTVNDYLAKRDAEWMGKIYRFLGLTVGKIIHELDDNERRQMYACDITYGTNNEIGFDYLRDNMKYELSQCVQRGHYYAIVDEVDSILIDEARTPLIISGPSEENTQRYYDADAVVRRLRRDIDFMVDEKARSAALSESGVERAEQLLNCGNLFDPANMEILHCVNQALVAHTLYHLDRHYVNKDGEIIIVDDFTGRLMPGRRWSDGLHQAIEAKEGVRIEPENQTLATITFQNLFRMYEKLAGMTGTAETEAEEFAKIYNLDVVVIPTHRPMIRDDRPDLVYQTLAEKWDAVVQEIKDCYERGQPVLVGTVSVENSEMLSKRLKRLGIPHNVLNAKYHEREAEIVAQAGRKKAVTIATNMAGRGTDILLGGNPEFLAREILKKKEINPEDATPEQWAEAVKEMKKITDAEHEEVVALGGLHILGTERHESRRIDNQLRGRAGRQGDPGSSRFYLSLEDDLMRIFAGERVRRIMDRLGGWPKGEPIESKMVSRAIERAQKSVEAHNFSIRKHLLEYDDVMNKQRQTIYSLRRQLLSETDQRDYILSIAQDLFEDMVDQYLNTDLSPQEWDFNGLKLDLRNIYGFDLEAEVPDYEHMSNAELKQTVWPKLEAIYTTKEALIGPDLLRQYERAIMLNVVDAQWKDHLLVLDHLREGIGLRGYAQRDPLVEYKRESFELFQAMLDRIDRDTIRFLWNIQVTVREPSAERLRRRAPRHDRLQYKHDAANVLDGSNTADNQPRTVRHEGPRVGPNEPCPCGSGKKYKKCHGLSH
ncbi:MAG: preprotein translocase subunit SecA [Acidobacteriota bacterium]|nr:preprotein translocase subunit SecA [Blastocatellia bacterium]MDW8239133.1 preprotein translocase subunit SecA [Acidobacteriota bacterium]